MNPRNKILTHRLVHGPVSRNTAHPGKAICPNCNDKMALAPFTIAAMTTVAFTIINHFKRSRLKRGLEPIMNFLCHRHFFL